MTTSSMRLLKVFTAQCVQLKKDGQAKVQHKPPLLDDDLKKLYESGVFNSDHPKTLLIKVFFEIMLCFCRRGRQNLRRLKKTDFEVHTDATGAKFVTKVRDEITKNHREDDEAEEGGVMYAQTEGVWCPVASFEKCLEHLNPKNEFLFQRPKKEVSSDAVVWNDNMVVGERLLGDTMKRISKEANLSRIYSNHSIRATAVTILDKSGFEARHIMTVSGHKNESSIRAYSKTDQTTRRRMSETLTTAGADNSVPSEHPVRLDSLTAENINLSPLLTLSQEEHVMRDLHFQTTHSQVSKNFAFHNCNVFFG